jgi:hypothetical protein
MLAVNHTLHVTSTLRICKPSPSGRKAFDISAMKGGQQYVDFIKPDAKGSPMGLARYMIEGDER